ncbi:arylesterase [Dichotomicrobium thermohalophilum]|uniref:Acyl-CoA thioesterase-1 n=1 Tax=Dichotomicrobium thermohalophilum TaxID=933063 RepID=A0A397Q1X2_9HYPH|nr:arylesterase [Dichotomicrobium thermohalophilum]RIA55490.1 acyl-CoA thioesterase-1 [Dichotomicrobium thermohalophilum]
MRRTIHGWPVALSNLALIVIYAALMAAVWPDRARAEQAGAGEEVVIVGFGDSLMAGYRLAPGKSFPAQLQDALREQGRNVRVVNAGVSGDTTADALARLDWALPDDADAVIVELGANDALRGFELSETRSALDEILSKLKARDLPVLLTGMEAPRNYGEDYAKAFRNMYQELSEKHETLFYPFFLKGVALEPELNMPDGIHPTAEGVAVIVENILPKVHDLIARARERTANVN